MGKNKKTIEVEGSTVEDAIKKALKFFNVSREALSVKVVCEEKRGLFGMAGAKPAKIKVTLIDLCTTNDKKNKEAKVEILTTTSIIKEKVSKEEK